MAMVNFLMQTGSFSDTETPSYHGRLRNEFTLFKNFDFSFLIYSIWGTYDEFQPGKNNGGFLDRQNSYKVPYWTPKSDQRLRQVVFKQWRRLLQCISRDFAYQVKQCFHRVYHSEKHYT